MTERKRHFRKKPRALMSNSGALLAGAAAAAARPPPSLAQAPPAFSSITEDALYAAAAALAAAASRDGEQDQAQAQGQGLVSKLESALLKGSTTAAATATPPRLHPSATFTLRDEASGGHRVVRLKRQYNRTPMPVEAFDLLQPLAERLAEILNSASAASASASSAANGGGVCGNGGGFGPPKPAYVYRRHLTSSTYLTRIHVVAEMAREILPEVPENEEIFFDEVDRGGSGSGNGSGNGNFNGDGNGNGASTSSSPAAPPPLPPQQLLNLKRKKGPTSREPNGTLFRTKIRFLDSQGREWPVTYGERIETGRRRRSFLFCEFRGYYFFRQTFSFFFPFSLTFLLRLFPPATTTTTTTNNQSQRSSGRRARRTAASRRAGPSCARPTGWPSETAPSLSASARKSRDKTATGRSASCSSRRRRRLSEVDREID